MSEHEIFESLIVDDSFIRWVRNPKGEDAVHWTRWRSQNPENLEAFYEAKDFVNALCFQELDPEKNNHTSLKERIDSRIGFSQPKESSGAKVWMKMAASFLLLGFCVYFIFSAFDKPEVTDLRVVTRPGQKSSIILSDGTQVWLNGGSTLSYPERFTSDQRSVSLIGEGYFCVSKDPQRPFIVHAGGVDVRVLGTAFNLRSYPDDSEIETVLVEGEVELQYGSSRSESIKLLPNKQAVYQKLKRTITVEEVNAVRLSSWKEGVLHFDNEPVSEVMKQLKRWYGKEIELTAGAECRISAKIKDETLEEVLELLHLTSKAEYFENNEKIYLTINCIN